CFYNDDGDNVTYYSATVRVDGSAAQIRRHGGEQGSTHLEEVTAKPVSGFLTPSRDAEEAPVNTFDFTCELDPEADTVTSTCGSTGSTSWRQSTPTRCPMTAKTPPRPACWPAGESAEATTSWSSST